MTAFFKNHRTFNFNYGGKDITFETGKYARQADGACMVTCGDTQVLVTVCSSTSLKDGQDFFPLTVDYNEKFYAAGKFLGGFMKREARPTTLETLNARLIDRPLRPLFPSGYMFETFVQATVYSYGESADPEILASLGASVALSISDVPFNGPLGAVKLGRVQNQWVLNPTPSDLAKSTLEMVVSATPDAIMMVEGECHQLTEVQMLEALKYCHKEIATFCQFVNQLQKEVGKPKRTFVSAEPNRQVMKGMEKHFAAHARNVLAVKDKADRQKAIKEFEMQVSLKMSEVPADFGLKEGSSYSKDAVKSVDELLYQIMRSDIVEREARIGGRKLNEVRAIETEIDVLKTPHGSALFTRGETQVLSSVTLGGKEGEQMVDSIRGLAYQKFYLHYSFPPFSVGEAKGVFKVGRRELGHGNLAERALKNCVDEKFNSEYTIRLTCEVLESNGSSSMGSVCAGSLALMAAGVPLKAPVAGVAMGLVKEGNQFKILTDILGDEDHLGDMDFKVAGTAEGITAIQMDIKITGITFEIMEKALAQAKEARLHILKEMSKTITATKTEMRGNAPKILSTQIAPDKIGALIGPGGKNIKALQENYKISVEVSEEGLVRVLGHDAALMEEAITVINLQINGPKIGGDYPGQVVTVKEYGAFVDIGPGVSGLLHVSEFCDARVRDVNEFVFEGMDITVRVMDIDKFGKIRLSAKAVKPLTPLPPENTTGA